MVNEHHTHVARQDPTPTTGVLIPSPTIQFTLESPSPTSCSFFGINWFYNGADQPLNLYITNNNVPQNPPPLPARPPNTFTNAANAVPTTALEPIPLLTQLITVIDPFELEYEWPAVSVPPGWYIFNGSIPTSSYSRLSPSFYVWSSTDTSCLAVQQSTSSPISSTISPTATQNPSSSSLPVGASSSSSTNIGAIVGVSIAAVVVVAGVLIGWLCFIKKRRKPTTTTRDYPNGTGHAWNGLGSTDSRNILTSGGKNYPSKSSKQQRSHRSGPQSRESFGSGMLSDDGASALEKTGKQSFDGSLALSSMPVLNANGVLQRPRGRTQSQASVVSNAYSVNEYSGSGSRRPSAPDSVVAAGRRSVDSTSYPPQSPSAGAAWTGRHQYPTSPPSTDVSRTQSHNTPPSQSPSIRAPQLQNNPSQGSSGHSHQPSPVSPSSSSVDSPTPDVRPPVAKQSNRQSLGGKKRKPVPVYDPSTDEHGLPSPAVPQPISPSYAHSSYPIAQPTPQQGYGKVTPTMTSPFSPSTSPAPTSFLADSPQPPQPHIGHYTTRSQAGRDQSVHSLHHKSSFGPNGIEGKPLHYLIPDMPAGAS